MAAIQQVQIAAVFSTGQPGSGQGYAVVHATDGYGFSIETFRLANCPVQEGERQRRAGGRAAWMRREVQRAMDGPSGPTSCTVLA